LRIAEVKRKPTAKQIAELMGRSRHRVAHYMKPVPKPARGRPLELPEGCANREDHGRLLEKDLLKLQDKNACSTAYDVRTPAQGRGPGDTRDPVPAFVHAHYKWPGRFSATRGRPLWVVALHDGHALNPSWSEVTEENAKRLGLTKRISDKTYWNRMHPIGIRALPYRSVPAQDEDDPAKRVEFCEAFLQESKEWWEKHKKWICPQGTEAHEPYGEDEVFVRNTVWYDAHKSPSEKLAARRVTHSVGVHRLLCLRLGLVSGLIAVCYGPSMGFGDARVVDSGCWKFGLPLDCLWIALLLLAGTAAPE
jgi:hypothetical protein